jgi:aryl sulfotransferase
MPVSVESLTPYRSAVSSNARWRNFEPRDGDIFVCTPAKCGTTWTQAIIASLLWPDGKYPAPILHMSPWIEFEVEPIETILERLAQQRHRRFIKTHTPLDGIPLFPQCKYVCVARDGRDAFMSFCNHLERFKDDVRESLNVRAAREGIVQLPPWNGDIHGFFPLWFTMMGFPEHIATFWQHRSDPNVLLVHYNDLKADLGGEMRRIAGFLGIEVPESKWPAVVERCTFESMQNQGETLGEIDRLFEGGTKGFIFKGTNGRWRDVLTADELASYAAHVSRLLPGDALRWLEGGGCGLDRGAD